MQRARETGVSCTARFLKSKQEDSNKILQLRNRFIPDDAVTQDSVGLVSPYDNNMCNGMVCSTPTKHCKCNNFLVVT